MHGAKSFKGGNDKKEKESQEGTLSDDRSGKGESCETVEVVEVENNNGFRADGSYEPANIIDGVCEIRNAGQLYFVPTPIFTC